MGEPLLLCHEAARPRANVGPSGLTVFSSVISPIVVEDGLAGCQPLIDHNAAAIFINGSNVFADSTIFFHQDIRLFQSQPPEVKSLNTLSPGRMMKEERARSLQMMDFSLEFGSFFILTFVSNRACKTSDIIGIDFPINSVL